MVPADNPPEPLRVAASASVPALTLVDPDGRHLARFRLNPDPHPSAFREPYLMHWRSISLGTGADYSYTLPGTGVTGKAALAYEVRVCSPGRWCGEIWSNWVGP
jgi:hypothetical protein